MPRNAVALQPQKKLIKLLHVTHIRPIGLSSKRHITSMIINLSLSHIERFNIQGVPASNLEALPIVQVYSEKSKKVVDFIKSRKRRSLFFFNCVLKVNLKLNFVFCFKCKPIFLFNKHNVH